MPWGAWRAADGYFSGFWCFALAWGLTLRFGLPLPLPVFVALAFLADFAALRAAFFSSVLRWRGTSLAVASAAFLPTWGRTLW